MQRTIILSLSFFLLIPILWFILGQILRVTKGFGLKDEGLYLLAADPPTPSASWGFPFGWHTGPLFTAVSYDISAFRTLGGVILVVTAGLLGLSIARVLNLGNLPYAKWLLFGTISTAVTGSLFYYIPMLRTPSYNWLNLVGIQVALAASLLALVGMRKSRASYRGWNTYLMPLVAALGLFITIPAKPSTFPVLLALLMIAFTYAVGLRSALRWGTTVLGFSLAWLALALAAGIWPWDFIDVFTRAINAPQPSDGQTITGAILNFAVLPQDLLRYVNSLTIQQWFVAFFAIMLLAVPFLARKRWIALRLTGFFLASLSCVSISGLSIPGLNSQEIAADWLAPERTTAGMLMLISALLVSHRLPQDYTDTNKTFGRIRIVTIILLFVSPFIFAFGSASGLLSQSGVSAGFLFLAALAVVSVARLGGIYFAFVSMVSISVLTITASGFLAGWKNPYDIDSMSTQMVEMSVGSHGAQLEVSAEQGEILDLIRTQAVSNGWVEGTPILDVSYTWHPGVVYFLGGLVPNSLMMTIFGYSQSEEIFEFNINQQFDFSRSWLLTSNPTLLDDAGKRATLSALALLADHTNRVFPKGYDCVDAGNFQLWRPTADEYRKGRTCDSGSHKFAPRVSEMP